MQASSYRQLLDLALRALSLLRLWFFLLLFLWLRPLLHRLLRLVFFEAFLAVFPLAFSWATVTKTVT